MNSSTRLSQAAAAATEVVETRFRVKDYAVLLKPRVMSLVVFTGCVGMVLAPTAINFPTAIAAILCIALGAGAAGAINMWYDQDIDRVMTRTMHRPLPAGRLESRTALAFGIFLAAGSVAVMAATVNILAASLLALTVGYYVFIYTVWLKRRTPQNIVIGGAAGAFPPMIGWAAATGDVGTGALVLFAIIFFWTPPHSWALALFRKGDYDRAGVPMMPVVAGERSTRRQILIYSCILVATTFLPLPIGMSGYPYGVVAGILGALFLRSAVRVARSPDGDMDAPKALFLFSILYLFLIFSALVADRALAAFL
ncbi:MAG: heme o synthase [Rhodospirillales bacterium]